MSERLTHLDEQGRARMVDVSTKPVTTRRAVAQATVRMKPTTLALIREGKVKKGDALTVARLAGIQGAKHTAALIPLCHPLRLDWVDVAATLEAPDKVVLRSVAVAQDRTGVEMEALTAATTAGLALIDMIKGVDRLAHITDVVLLEKEGGRSGTWKRADVEATS